MHTGIAETYALNPAFYSGKESENTKRRSAIFFLHGKQEK